jgi:hypothetical protein
LRRCKRSDRLVFAKRYDRTVLAVAWIAVNQQTAANHVEHPIFGNFGAGVESGFGGEVKVDRGVGDLDGDLDG